jgi:hypothetical protein
MLQNLGFELEDHPISLATFIAKEYNSIVVHI